MHILLGGENLALNKPATQSTNYSNDYLADKAVNGITGDKTDCSHTAGGDKSKWWKVDLQAKYSIGRILLYNRPDHCKLYCKICLGSLKMKIFLNLQRISFTNHYTIKLC